MSGFFGPPPLRIAMVRRAADFTAADFSGGVSVPWDQEVYDTDNFHDNVTNNTRLTVPAGCNFARLVLTLTMGNNTIGADITAIIRKNAATSYDGVGQQSIDAPTAAPCITVSTGWVSVIAGDYFEATLFNVGDTSIDITAARSSFSIEVR